MEKRKKGSRYDDLEEKLIVRFENGKDYDTFESLRDVFLSILDRKSQSWGKRQMDILASSPARAQIARSAGFDMGIPKNSLDMGKLNAKVGA